MFKDLNPILHSQLRLAIISILIGVREAEFTYLQRENERNCRQSQRCRSIS